MVPGKEGDAPMGATLQPINIGSLSKVYAVQEPSPEASPLRKESRSSRRVREEDQEGGKAPGEGLPAESACLGKVVYQNTCAKKRQEQNLKEDLEDAVQYLADLEMAIVGVVGMQKYKEIKNEAQAIRENMDAIESERKSRHGCGGFGIQ